MATPTRIEPHSATEMLLAFSDEAGEYAVSYSELRFYCPCAGCVDEHTGERTIKREQVQAGIRPTGVQLVGRYAVQINWSDRHNTGMYHYDRLFEISQKIGRRLK
jgi:DUF971 family protein